MVRGRQPTPSSYLLDTCEQARLVKTVKVSVPTASGTGIRPSATPWETSVSTGQGGRYRLGHQPVGSQIALSPCGKWPLRSAQCTVRPL